MPFAPLKLPPGIARPGTKYDARGRWFDANLVRWHEDAMQPEGGWQPLERTSAVAVSAAISDDGGAFTDETTDANDVGADDVVLVPATPVNNDAFYIGYSFRFTETEINVGTVATDGTVTWEYYNGTAWTALSGVQDGTTSFKTIGTNSVVWTLPWDWSKTTVNSQGPYYYVRARVSAAGTSTATGTQVWIGTGPVDVDEPVRGMLAWRANDQTPHLVTGTPTEAYVFSGGVLTEVTPAGFTTGGADAALSTSNYGAGAYGAGPYGTGDVAQATLTEANTWQFDTFGEDVVACAYSDGKIYQWDKSAGGAMAAITNAPTGCKGVVVTPERFVVALAAGADGRKLQWCDQENITVWTAAVNNQAGDFILPGTGGIMAGRRGRNETLIWTDVDLFVMTYTADILVYSIQQRGAHCGPISRHAMQVYDTAAAWMGQRSFFVYDGAVRPIKCEVSDYVFADLNRVQASKIACFLRSEFGEIIWHYPSSASTENDRYVKWNTRENHWNIGQLQRTAGVDRGAFGYPIAADANGVVYQHEQGTTYLDEDGAALTPYAESGPIEIAQGQQVMMVREFIPDEDTLGDVQVSLYAAMYPTATETLLGPYTPANPTTFRASGRQIRVKLEQVRANWRFGTPRLDVESMGQR